MSDEKLNPVIFNLITKTYSPTPTQKGVEYCSTIDLYHKLQSHYPGDYTTQEIAVILHNMGFTILSQSTGLVWQLYSK